LGGQPLAKMFAVRAAFCIWEKIIKASFGRVSNGFGSGSSGFLVSLEEPDPFCNSFDKTASHRGDGGRDYNFVKHYCVSDRRSQ
jgi:hypothetical protein